MKTSIPFSKGHCLLFLLVLGSQPLWAQNNYIANTANSSAPGHNNTLIGSQAGNSITSGANNTFLGTGAGFLTTTGSDNIFIGASSAGSNTTGSANTFVGVSTGNFNSSGSNNVFLGSSTGAFNTTGNENTFTGAFAGQNNRSGNSNTFMGYSAGNFNNSGSNNAFMGVRSGYNNTSGASNTFMGAAAGTNNTTGNSNAFVGSLAGEDNQTGSENTFIGVSAGESNRIGGQNTFIGSQAGRSTTASLNTFVGYQAGYTNTAGTSNVFIGNAAGFNNTTGQNNMFLGSQAGTNNTTGSYNLFIGNAAGTATTTGVGNTAIGDGAGYYNTTGQRNTMVGQYAGGNSQVGNDNVFIGFGSKAGSANPTNLTNAVAIGAYSIVSQSNSVILGNAANVGIGNSAPTARLHITTGSANTSGLRLENLTSSSPAISTNQTKFLSVDGSGYVVMASTGNGGREAAGESLWERKGTFLQNTQGEAIIIGSGVSRTPSGYKLFVEEGILTERVKVAVKNTDDWSDKVFAPSYSLRPLADVDQYIQKHQHLPGVLSAKEMVKQGNDLHKTDAKLLEKIEELTLYSIQLEKTNQHLQENDKKQQAEIDELKSLVKQLLEKK